MTNHSEDPPTVVREMNKIETAFTMTFANRMNSPIVYQQEHSPVIYRTEHTVAVL